MCFFSGVAWQWYRCMPCGQGRELVRERTSGSTISKTPSMFAGWIPWKWIVCGCEPPLTNFTRRRSSSVARMTGPGRCRCTSRPGRSPLRDLDLLVDPDELVLRTRPGHTARPSVERAARRSRGCDRSRAPSRRPWPHGPSRRDGGRAVRWSRSGRGLRALLPAEASDRGRGNDRGRPGEEMLPAQLLRHA